MPRLVPLSAREVIRRLRQLGWEGPIAGGKHSLMHHREKQRAIPIPIHGDRDIRVRLLHKILREAEVEIETWLNL